MPLHVGALLKFSQCICLALLKTQTLPPTFAVQEATPAFNPYVLKTKASLENDQYFIDGEKTLVILGDLADVFLVSADFNGKPDVFVVQVGDTISIKNTPAMGLKATETATLNSAIHPLYD